MGPSEYQYAAPALAARIRDATRFTRSPGATAMLAARNPAAGGRNSGVSASGKDICETTISSIAKPGIFVGFMEPG